MQAERAKRAILEKCVETEPARLPDIEQLKRLMDSTSAFTKLSKAFNKEMEKSRKQFLDLADAMMSPIGTAMHEMVERLSKLPDNKTIHASQEMYRSSSNWEFPDEPSKAPFLYAQSTHRLGVFMSGYPACIKCGSVYCEHIERIIANGESDGQFLKSAFEDAEQRIFFVPLDDGKAWFAVRLEDQTDPPSAETQMYSVVFRGNYAEAGEVNLGFVTLGLEGYYSIQLLIENFLRANVIGRKECKSSTHWKTKTDKKITTVSDAVAWLDSQHCARCKESVDEAITELTPQKEGGFPKVQRYEKGRAVGRPTPRESKPPAPFPHFPGGTPAPLPTPPKTEYENTPF